MPISINWDTFIDQSRYICRVEVALLTSTKVNDILEGDKKDMAIYILLSNLKKIANTFTKQTK